MQRDKLRILVHPSEIRGRRKEAELTQKKLSEEAGTTQAYISRIEKDEDVNVGSKSLEKITESLTQRGVALREIKNSIIVSLNNKGKMEGV